MQVYADLHTHSCHSDGTDSLPSLLQKAIDNQLHAIAFTDHDTLHVAEDLPVSDICEVIPGVEFSTELNGQQCHLLGYWLETSSTPAMNVIHQLRQSRDDRNTELCHKVSQHFQSLDRSFFQGQTLGRPHIAQWLVENGHAKNVQYVFDNFFRKGQILYTPRKKISCAHVVETIKAAGGAAVLAHPKKSFGKLSELEPQLNDIVDAGLDGIEVYYPGHSANAQFKLRQMCTERNLVCVGGSDYHGEPNNGRYLASVSSMYGTTHSQLEMLRMRR